jgi:hypothetical protein
MEDRFKEFGFFFRRPKFHRNMAGGSNQEINFPVFKLAIHRRDQRLMFLVEGIRNSQDTR